MAFLFGGGSPRTDAEQEAGARRRRVALARDLGDELSLARNVEPRPARQRRGGWIALALVGLALVGGVKLIGGDNQLVPQDCRRPRIGLSAVQVSAGASVGWQVAGPPEVPYAVVLDGPATAAGDDRRVDVDAGSLVAGPFTVTGCRTSAALLTAPAAPGGHTVVLLARSSDGYRRVANLPLTVG